MFTLFVLVKSPAELGDRVLLDAAVRRRLRHDRRVVRGTGRRRERYFSEAGGVVEELCKAPYHILSHSSLFLHNLPQFPTLFNILLTFQGDHVTFSEKRVRPTEFCGGSQRTTCCHLSEAAA